MRFGILASESSWYYRDLERAATACGHSCTRLDFARLKARVDATSSIVQSQAPDAPEAVLSIDQLQSSATCDAIVVRTMPPGSLEQVVFRMDALGQLAAAGTTVVNSPKSLECAVDKYLTTARLQRSGLPVPETIVCEHEDDASIAFEQLGRDVVVKPLFGSEGRGIVRVTDPDLAHRTFRTLMRLNSVLYLQRYIDHGGFDIRVLVLGGQVLGGMTRHSPHDFRTNVSREAIAAAHRPTAREADLALAAAAATETFIAGIDLLYDRSGRCYVIEVNAVPGWQAFARVNQVDIAAKLIDRISQR